MPTPLPNFSPLKHIMLVDDDEISLFLTKKILNTISACQTITEFTLVDSAIDALLKNKNNKSTLPDLILLDINMPMKTGWDFMDIFINLELAFTPQVVILSSSDAMTDRIKATQYPKHIRGYFNKPVKRTDIIDLINHLRQTKLVKE